MENHSQHHLPQNGQHGPRGQRNTVSDFRGYNSRGPLRDGNSNGAVPVPPRPPGMNGNGFSGNMQGSTGFGPAAWDISRSPPSKQNTSHVPCKFYLQGTCQAGKACPFSHEKTLAEMTPCKYFAKGNCKFGAKCLLPHILPDGRMANPGIIGMTNPYNMGRGIHMNQQNDQRNQMSMMDLQSSTGSPPSQQFNYPTQDDYFIPQKTYNGAPYTDTAFISPPGSNYGSPPGDGRLPLSPSQKGLSVLDAPLPASFDSQGVSHFARHGPMASSVPSRFGLDSQFISTSPSRAVGTTSRGFGNLNDLATVDVGRNDKLNGLASSPPYLETLPKRIMMHSERQLRPGVMSSSLPRPILKGHLSDDEDDNSGFEDDLDQVPSSLHDDLLTPQEKLRRFSKTDEESGTGPGVRRSLTGFGSPPGSKGASPSRYGNFFAARNKPDPDALGASGTSPFGHVGSPLRNSSLNPEISPLSGLSPRPRSGDMSPFLSSPPRNSSIGGMSMISQQLQRTRLTTNKPTDVPTPDANIASLSNTSRIPSTTSTASARLDRAVSSSSIGRERIDEEQCLFSMDDDEEQKEKDRKRQQLGSSGGGAAGSGVESSGAAGVKRWSGGGWNITSTSSSGKSSPKFGPIGSGTPQAAAELKDGAQANGFKV